MVVGELDLLGVALGLAEDDLDRVLADDRRRTRRPSRSRRRSRACRRSGLRATRGRPSCPRASRTSSCHSRPQRTRSAPSTAELRAASGRECRGSLGRLAARGSTRREVDCRWMAAADERLREYARLAVHVGVNLQPGQLLGDQRARRARAARARGREGGVRVGRELRRRALHRPARAPRPHRARGRGRAGLLAAVARQAARRPRRDGRRAALDHRQPGARDLRRPRRRPRRPLAHARGGRGEPAAQRRRLQLVDRRVPERGLGHGGLRRARRRAALGRRSRRPFASTSPTRSRRGASTSRSSAAARRR